MLRHLRPFALLGVPLLAVLSCFDEEATAPTAPAEGELATAAVSGSSKIAFVSNRNSARPYVTNIYTMYPDGSGLRRLTGDICSSGDECVSGQPNWSPNGGRIAFSSSSRTRNNSDIWVMDRNGSSKKRLTTDSGDDGSPAWSPDGLRFVFTRSNLVSDIWLMRADGTGQKNFSNDVSADFESSAAWSLDGKKIAWRREQSAPAQVAVKNSDGTGRMVILPHSSYGGAPHWSPRAMHVAYYGGDQDFSNIYISNPEGTWWRKLTTKALCRSAFSCLIRNPRWSPDGQTIAFVVFGPGTTSDIYVVNRDGTGIKRLTTAPAGDTDPTWSPDGRKLAFVSLRDGNAEIYVMNANGSGQKNVTRNPAQDNQPTWSH